MTVRHLIQQAIAICGSQKALGRATDYSQNGIWQALQRGTVSDKLAVAIHKATKGAVSKSKLRPDLWPEE